MTSKAHCQAIIDNPDLLLAQDASWITGAMDGKIWDQPDVFYAVQHLIPSLPHIQGALIAFFEGALETWVRFSSEFTSGGVISSASSQKRAEAFARDPQII